MEYSHHEWNADAVLGVGSIKGEISSILTLMRWTESYRGDPTDNREGDLVRSFRYLNEALEGVYDLREVNCVTYIAPFHHVIVSRGTSGPLTSAALSSLSKFALYGFLNPHFPGIEEGIEMVAECISGCIFEETDWESDEVIFMKMLELSALTFRCGASSMLSVRKAWEIYKTCLNIHHQRRASKILKSEAESTLRHLTLTTFSRAVFVSSNQFKQQKQPFSSGLGAIEETYAKLPNHHQKKSMPLLSGGRIDVEEDIVDAVKSDADADVNNVMWNKLSSNNKFGEDTGVVIILCKIMNSLSSLMDMQSRTQTIEGVKFALSLVNIALEAGGPALGGVGVLVDIMRGDMCRHLLRASQSDDLAVFGLALRVVFNLFVSIKDHMKVQLEVYLTSVHLRLLRQGLDAKGVSPSLRGIDKSTITPAIAREELALESLLDFCREPSLMCDIYTNYDCDVQCTNLFRTIIDSLCTRAITNTKKVSKGRSERRDKQRADPELAAPGKRREVVLNRLALDGVFAVLHAVATRVVGKRSRGISISPPPSPSEDDASERSRLDSTATTSSSAEQSSSAPSAISVEAVVPTAAPLHRAYSDPTPGGRDREGSPETDRIGDQVDAWCSSEPSSPPAEVVAEEEGFFVSSPARYSSSYSASSSSSQHLAAASSQKQIQQGHGQASTALLHPHPKSRSLSYSPPGGGKTASAEPDHDHRLLHYPEFSGYAQDHVEVEVLRERKLKKQNLGVVAQMFNARPLKPEWLRRALELSCISSSDTADSQETEGGEPRKQQKWDLSKYSGGMDANMAIANPAAVALFLRNTPGLGKPEIGEFISRGPADKYPFFAAVLQEYVHTFSFPSNSGFSEALRTFLGTFRMPGESQCIDRLMEAFSAKLFLDLGPGRPFINADAAFVLAFSTIILNTDLHNPNLPPAKRMSKDAFIKNNRGINDGKDLPREYLSRLYDEIRIREIQVDMEVTDDGESLASHLSGIDLNTWHRLLDRSAADQAPAAFTPTVSARFAHSAHSRRPSSASSAPSLQDRDMFLVMANPVLQAMDMVWAGPLAGDDLLTGRMIEGVADYAAICVSLGLRDILTALVETLSLRARSMMSHPGHLAGLAQSYGDESTEANLIYLLGPGFEAMLKSAAPRVQEGEAAQSSEGSATGARGEGRRTPHAIEAGDEGFTNQRWHGAHLVGGELVLRVLFYIVDKYSEALSHLAWAALLELLMWVRQLGSLSPDLAKIDDGAAFWRGGDNSASLGGTNPIRDNGNIVEVESLNAPSSFALECHASAKGLRRTEDGRYQSINDDGQDSKGIWGAVTGILFGSVTLTEDADTYLQMQQQGQSRKDRAGPLDREKEKEIETLDGNSSIRVTSFLRGHYHRKELLRATLIYSRANEMLSPCANLHGQGRTDMEVSMDANAVHRQPALFDAMFSLLQSKTATFCAQKKAQMHPSRYARGHENEEALSGEESGYESVVLTTDDDETDGGSSINSGQRSHRGSEQGSSQTFEIEAVLALEWASCITLALLQDNSSKTTGRSRGAQVWLQLNDFLLSLVQVQAEIIASSARAGSEEDLAQQQESVMQCPYLVERAIGHSLRGCMVVAARGIYLGEAVGSDASYWGCLAQISSLPRAILMPIASKFGAACTSLVQVVVHTPRCMPCLASSLDQWHVLLSLLAAATAGLGGRDEAWKGLCHVLDSRHLDTVSFAPSRLLLLRFLHGAYPGDEEEVQRRSKNAFLQPAMGRLVGLVAMLLGGYVDAGFQTSNHTEGAYDATVPKTPKKGEKHIAAQAPVTRHGELASFLLPKRRDADPSLTAGPLRRGSITTDAPVDLTPVQLAQSTYREIGVPAKIGVRDPLPGLAQYFHDHHAAVDEESLYIPPPAMDASEEPTITVRAFRLDAKETEHLWLDTVHRLAEIVDPRSHSIEVSRLACYNLRAALAFGAAAQLPLNLWVQVLQDLIARLPLSLLPLAGKSQTSFSSSSSSSSVSEEKIHNYSAGSCLSACHVMLELLTSHTRTFRESNSLTFADSWLRFSAILAQNASFATRHAGTSTSSSSSTLRLRRVHDEMVDIITALLQALRPPPYIQIVQDEKGKANHKVRRRAPQRKAGLMGMLFGDAIGGDDHDEDGVDSDEADRADERLHEESGLSVDVSRALMSLGNKDHDAALLQTTWQTVVSQYPAVDAAIKVHDPRFSKALRGSMRTIEAATRVLAALDKTPRMEKERAGDGLGDEEMKSTGVPVAAAAVVNAAPPQPPHPEGHHTKTRRPLPLPSIQVRPSGSGSGSGSGSVTKTTPTRFLRDDDALSTVAAAKTLETTRPPPEMSPPKTTIMQAESPSQHAHVPTTASASESVLPLRSPMPLPRFLTPQKRTEP